MSTRQAFERSPETLDKPSRKSLRLTIIGVCVGVCVAALGVGIWALNTQGIRGQVTGCGVDAQGPYMDVRVTSIKGALGSTRHVSVRVAFTYDNYAYDQGAPLSMILTGWHTYGRVHGSYPPRHLEQSEDVTVQGRAVYRTPREVLLKSGQHGAYREFGPGGLVSKARVDRVTRRHPHWRAAHAKQEVVPDDVSKIRCILYSVSVQRQGD